MNAAHIHLIVNHFPIILPIMAILLLIWGMIAKSWDIQKSGLLLLILAGIASFVAMQSGEGAEHIVRKMAGIDKNYIHDHEEWAEKFALLNYINALLSIIAWWAFHNGRPFAPMMRICILIITLVGLWLGVETGNSGGDIRHTEIRSGAITPADGNMPGDVNKESGENED